MTQHPTQDSQSELNKALDSIRDKIIDAGNNGYTEALNDSEYYDKPLKDAIDAYVTTRVKEAELLKGIEINHFLNLYHQHAADDLEQYLNASSEEKENWA